MDFFFSTAAISRKPQGSYCTKRDIPLVSTDFYSRILNKWNKKKYKESQEYQLHT